MQDDVAIEWKMKCEQLYDVWLGLCVAFVVFLLSSFIDRNALEQCLSCLCYMMHVDLGQFK